MPKFYVANETQVPLMVGLFMEPRANDHPTKNTTIAPGERHGFSPTIAEYEIVALMVGDNHDHGDWNWHWPGLVEMTAPLELGFKMWHEGDLDWEMIKSLSSTDMEDVFGKSKTFYQKTGCGWGGTSTIHYVVTGGPEWIDEQEDKRIWRPGHTEEVLTSSDLKISKD